MNRSKIPWLVNAAGTPGYTWSPMSGCGPGLPCYDRCWARLYHVRYRGGDFGVKLHPEKLDEPLRLRKPSTIGVCLMGDLFHDDVPADFILRVISVMDNGGAERHTYTILTKRPERMRSVLMHELCTPNNWPTGGLPNVWLGVSCEDQETADERIPILLDTPAAHRWVSLEPQIVEVDLARFTCGECGVSFNENRNTKAATVCCPYCHHVDEFAGGITRHWFGGSQSARGDNRRIDLVIQGCESGPRRRPFHADWARSVRDQCAASGTAFYYKQAPILACEAERGCMKGCNDKCEMDERCRVPRVVVEKPFLDGRRHTDLPWTVTP